VTSDNCGVAAVTNDAPSSFPRGTNSVTWTVIDLHGNLGTCVQRVIVNGPPAPPERFTGIVSNGDGTFTVSFSGIPRSNYVVQVSANLLGWQSVQTNTLEKTEPGPTQTTTVRTYPCGLTARYGSNGRILIWSAPAKRSGDLNIIRIFRAKDCVVQPQGLGRRNRIYAGTDGRNTSVVVSCHGTGAATPLGLSSPLCIYPG